MSVDLEGRLRASLDAYAGLADDADATAGAPRPARRTGRWVPALVAAAVLLVVGGVFVVTGLGGGPSPEPVGAPAPRSTVSGEAVPGGPPATAVPRATGRLGPATKAPEHVVGRPYVFQIYTQCGVLGLDIDGTWFSARPALVEPGDHPPAGWASPVQRGTLTLTSRTTAEFRDDAGHVVQLVMAPGERPRPCR